jgi:hypothetical protein
VVLALLLEDELEVVSLEVTLVDVEDVCADEEYEVEVWVGIVEEKLVDAEVAVPRMPHSK